jgi:hypothetical protein
MDSIDADEPLHCGACRFAFTGKNGTHILRMMECGCSVCPSCVLRGMLDLDSAALNGGVGCPVCRARTPMGFQIHKLYCQSTFPYEYVDSQLNPL